MISHKTLSLGLIIGSVLADAAFAEERIIARVRQDSEGDITHVCGAPETWGRVNYLLAIEHIQSREHTYAVEIEGFPRVDVEIQGPPGRQYLKTIGDPYVEKNLDNLPDC